MRVAVRATTSMSTTTAAPMAPSVRRRQKATTPVSQGRRGASATTSMASMGGVIAMALLAACRRKPLARAMRRVQLQGGARGPHARRTPCTFHSEGGFAPLPNPPPRIRCAGKAGARKWNTPTWQAGNRSEIAPPSDRRSASSAGFARATDSWGRPRRGPPRPPPIERRRWALIIALQIPELGIEPDPQPVAKELGREDDEEDARPWEHREPPL